MLSINLSLKDPTNRRSPGVQHSVCGTGAMFCSRWTTLIQTEKVYPENGRPMAKVERGP